MTDAIEARVLAEPDREVTASQIGQWILEELVNVDEVAYVRFASVYKRYMSVNEFLEELKKMKGREDQANQPVEVRSSDSLACRKHVYGFFPILSPQMG